MGGREGERAGTASKLALSRVSKQTLTSKNPAASILFSIFTAIHLRFAAAIFDLARSARTAPLDRFLPLLGIGLMVLAMLTACRFLLPPPPAWTVPGGVIEWASALPGFISVRHFGSWTGAIAAGFMIALLYGTDRQVGAPAAFYSLASGMTFWSGTRGAVVAMAGVALITALTLRRLPSFRRIMLVLGLSGVALLASVFLAPAGDTAFSMFRFGSIGAPNAITSGRIELWHATAGRWLAAPWFGWGSGATFWEVYVGWAHTQPHNAILQCLVSWGLVGAAGALWLIGRSVAAVHRPGMTDEALRPITALLYALLLMSLQEGMLHYPRFIMLIMIGFALILARREDAEVDTLPSQAGAAEPA